MQLEAVLIGQVQDLEGFAGPFRSAIRKRAVDEPLAVGVLGLEGDAVADTHHHGGPDQALLAFPSASYPAWRAELGALPPLVPGGFGENLLVGGADEDRVTIGDVWRLGEVRLEVTMPRTPCNTLAQHLGVRDLVRRAAASGRTGWYLRVLTPGRLQAGLPIEVTPGPAPEWTIRRSLAVMLGHEQTPSERQALAACPALPARWRDRLRAGSA